MYGSFGRYPPGRITRLLYYFPNFTKLFWRLFRDPRVPFYKKAIPFIAGIICIGYLLFPSDVMLDFLPVIGYLDDATVILLIMVPSVWLFIRSCPRDLIKEHAHQISRSFPFGNR